MAWPILSLYGSAHQYVEDFYKRSLSKTESPKAIRKAIGASCSVSGLMTVFACAESTRRIIFQLVSIRVPALFNMGLALFSLAAFQNGWLPLVGHLDHFGGEFFGAFWWLIALRNKPISSWYVSL